jgi:hypothetical protein
MTGGGIAESANVASLTGADFDVKDLDAEFAAVFYAVISWVYDVGRVYGDDVFGGAEE